ncbi:ABC transporter ATP-binding protein [Pandoraea fibrosis]|uniref:ABC transporter ATP-binding protein n=2 Tax=Pandoraea fibrosis TaxID=1891094 RepID=A0A5E4YML3_9BURK|nr:ABC transporter ATP-binding protein [Pandoraea fibrosis]
MKGHEMASKHIIEATGLYKTFGSVTPAKDITVNIDAQSVVGLIGTNGAGKTTFVNMLTGYIKPDRGEIVFRGKRITGLAPRKITRLGIARSFQIPQLFGSQTARENIEIALAISGLSADLANESLARLGVLEFADMISGTLPEGVRKLLDIALAMVCKPEVLLLDEPTSGVAAEEKFDVMNRVLDAARALGITVLFVEHDMEIVRRYSDRVLAFCDGRILADGTADVVLADAQVRELIIGETVAAVPATGNVAGEVAHA